MLTTLFRLMPAEISLLHILIRQKLKPLSVQRNAAVGEDVCAVGEARAVIILLKRLEL